MLSTNCSLKLCCKIGGCGSFLSCFQQKKRRKKHTKSTLEYETAAPNTYVEVDLNRMNSKSRYSKLDIVLHHSLTKLINILRAVRVLLPGKTDSLKVLSPSLKHSTARGEGIQSPGPHALTQKNSKKPHQLQNSLWD